MPNPAIDLRGKQVFVTGGARGLGRAIAERLAGAGARIAITDLPGALDEADIPAGWSTHAVDLISRSAEDDLGAAIATLDRLDIVIANAGQVPPWRGIADLDIAEWDRVFRVNVTGMAMTLKVAATPLSASGGGSVVLMASINGFKAHPSQALYTATKHAVVGLMRAAALDLGRHGVRVNAIAPGPIATDALRARVETRHAAGGPSPADAFAAMVSETALGRIATADDVADAALYLASDLSGAVTGTVLPVECGLG